MSSRKLYVSIAQWESKFIILSINAHYHRTSSKFRDAGIKYSKARKCDRSTRIYQRDGGIPQIFTITLILPRATALLNHYKDM